MLEDTPTGSDTQSTAGPTTESAPAKKAAAKRAPAKTAAKKAPAKTAPAKTTAKKTTTRKTAAKKTADAPASDASSAETAPAKKAAAKKAAAKAPAAKKTTARKTTANKAAAPDAPTDSAAGSPVAVPLFQAPDAAAAPARKPRKKAADGPDAGTGAATDDTKDTAPKVTTRTRTRSGSRPKPDAPDVPDAPQAQPATGPQADDEQDGESGDGARRRRRRGGRRRRKSAGEGDDAQDSGQDGSGQGSQRGQSSGRSKASDDDDNDSGSDGDSDDGDSSSPSSRRRRRRRRTGEDGGDGGDDPQNTVTRVRKTRSAEDQITAVAGSTRLEAKKQRRREGREAGRRRAPIVSEAEFLARRESVERVMAIRQRDDLTQIAVIEDKVLVEHYVARESQTSLIGNVYLGRVQNVLPSMEAAFIDIGKGRNAVLYAGEVNWSALGHKDGQPRKIESVLSSGQPVLVQVTKDPVGNKGARLSSQISLAGRFLVYVPDGTNSGISRKLPDTERSRLKALLKEIVPDSAGVIVRTAAEGASEEELTSDVERLKARWEDIERGAKKASSGAQLLYGEPDLMLKVVRDLFTEDFAKLVVSGDDAWDTVQGYVTHVAPDLEERLEKYDPSGADLFTTYRIDEQIQKGLDRKVWLPSGGSLVIDRTEAMTVVDVNTGKFIGSGGNLEETVTKNNLEAAEEMVRQLRLRDIGGIIVIDFIDMVLESNRDLVLRRLVECLGRDRTRHQVAEVTSLGLVQMTRKRIGTGLVEAFSENCEHCNGRGVVISDMPVEPKRDQESKRGARRSRGGRGRGEDSGQQDGQDTNGNGKAPSPKDVAAMARTPKSEEPEDADEADEAEETPEAEQPAESQSEQPTETQPERPAEKPVVKTTSRRSRSTSKPADKPAEKADEPAEPPTAVEQPVADAAPEPPTEPEPTPEPTPEPVAPQVVTRTRRRSASRPAGPPTTSGVPASPEPATAPESASALPGVIGEPPVDGAVEPGTADTEIGTRPVVEHVPVKKRGSRKR